METNRYTLKPRYEDITSTLRTLFLSPVWWTLLLPALVLTLGVFVGYGVARLHFLIPIVALLAIPACILLIRQPFNAIVIWLVIGPFFVITPNTTTRYIYWMTHRALIPGATIIALVNGAARKRLRFDLADFFLSSYLLTHIFSVLCYYPDNPLPELYHVYDWVLVGTARFWLIRMTAPREAQLKRLMVAFIVMSIAQGSVGLMMNFSATRAILPEYWLTSDRTTGTLRRVAEFSTTLTAAMLLVAHYAFYVRKRLAQIVCFVALLIGSVCLVLSFSRGTWLASIIVALLAIVLYRRMSPYILIMAVIIVLVLTTNVFADHIAFAAERLNHQSTIDSRLISNYAHLGMIQAKPLLGWGHGNYNRYHLPFVKPVEGVPFRDVNISSHNTHLSMAVELGLLGLTLYFMPWLLLLKRSITAYKRLPREGFYSRYLLVVLWLGVVFWFVVTNFMNMRLAPWGNTWVWLPLGLIASVVDASKEFSSNEERKLTE